MSEILNILSSVGFNWHVALANFFNFLIILVLLNKFFFGKLGKTISERHQIIERGLSNASDAERALANAEEEKKKIIKEAKKESEGIIISAKDTAKTVALSITQQADEEMDAKKAALLKKEETLKDSVEKEFALRAPELVAKLYAKTLRAEMTQKDNDAFIARMQA
jgi:F-type H+-transporting ATPase subunit b